MKTTNFFAALSFVFVACFTALTGCVHNPDATDAGSATTEDSGSPGPDGCVPSCSATHICGADGCGGQCGGCYNGQSCEAGQCVNQDAGSTADDGATDAGDTHVVPPDSCTPHCGGKECGPDGCGGSCGTCGAGQACEGGKCAVTTCTPKCNGKQCGSNGCNGVCGVCGSGKECSTAGQCVQVPPTCVPDCNGKQCGSNGCGGQCGNGCSAGYTCQGGTCHANHEDGSDCDLDSNHCTIDYYQGGQCVAGSQVICGANEHCDTATGTCNPNPPQDLCAGKDCSDDDPCTINEACDSATGACVSQVDATCCHMDSDCMDGFMCGDPSDPSEAFTCVPVQPSGDATVYPSWPIEFPSYHVGFQGWYCKGGTLSADGTTATDCEQWSDWKEFVTWNDDPISLVQGKSFTVPHGSWLFFDPVYNTSKGGKLFDWCDSITGFSTGVMWKLDLVNGPLVVTIVPNGFGGCNGRVFVP